MDSLFLFLKSLFVNEFPLTTREIEKLSTKAIILQEFGTINAQYLNSSKQTSDAIVFVENYYKRSNCNRCLNSTCSTCKQLYAFFISRYWKIRNQSKEIYRVVVVWIIFIYYF